MRGSLPLATLLLFAALPPPAAAERFIVGTRGAAKRAMLPAELADRPMHRFRSVDGFAIEMSTAEAEALRRSGAFRFVEPDYERHAAGVARGTAAADMAEEIPWGVVRVGAPALWPFTRGAGVRVGVLDTGSTFLHPDFRPARGGRRAAVLHPPPGWDFADDDADPTDDMSHGTHVAGIIGAQENAIGVVGIAPEAQLYALRVLRLKDGIGIGKVSDIIDAVDWAIENDLRILNLSLTSDQPSIAEEEAFERAEDAGILVIAASGNGADAGAVGLGYPAGYASVFAVGAIDERDAVASFSQRGAGLDLVAPGVEILSTVIPGHGPGELTEIAAPDGSIFFAFRMEGAPYGTARGALVPCGIGRPEEFPAEVRGNIALIRRGTLFFHEKVRNAKAAGAAAAVIYNNEDDWFEATLIRDATGAIDPELEAFPWIPAATTSGEIGEWLVANAGPGWLRSGNWTQHANLSGTSMAAPHVTGVAALLWSLVPQASAGEIRNALLTGATDLGAPGWDELSGHGVVDAAGAAAVLAPERAISPLSSPRREPAAPAR